MRGTAPIALLSALVVLTGCTSASNATSVTRPGANSSSSSTGSRSPATPDFGTRTASSAAAAKLLASMSMRQRVGQLLMVDCPSTGVASATRTAITKYDVGSVILDGTNTAGRTADHRVTSDLQQLAPNGDGLFIATDQEGGEVQRLQGSGFSRMPSGVQQGQLAPSTLKSDATTWGHQLRKAGVNVNLAPVLDTVPPHFGSNPPIGNLDREYGHTTGRVTSHGLAFAAGMAAAGIDATGKHFPGLGRVRGNTDTTAGVTDHVTTRHSAYLKPYAAAVKAHIPFMMMSTAIYAKIDPGVPAAFSSAIVTGMLRGNLGFRGVIISDDLGAAAQVGSYSVGSRAVDFVKAGGDMALTVVASDAGPMTHALLAEAKRSPSFAKKVDAAALLILQAKQSRGLV